MTLLCKQFPDQRVDRFEHYHVPAVLLQKYWVVLLVLLADVSVQGKQASRISIRRYYHTLGEAKIE